MAVVTAGSAHFVTAWWDDVLVLIEVRAATTAVNDFVDYGFLQRRQ
jgi:hypothetical protein